MSQCQMIKITYFIEKEFSLYQKPLTVRVFVHWSFEVYYLFYWRRQFAWVFLNFLTFLLSVQEFLHLNFLIHWTFPNFLFLSWCNYFFSFQHPISFHFFGINLWYMIIDWILYTTRWVQGLHLLIDYYNFCCHSLNLKNDCSFSFPLNHFQFVDFFLHAWFDWFWIGVFQKDYLINQQPNTFLYLVLFTPFLLRFYCLKLF